MAEDHKQDAVDSQPASLLQRTWATVVRWREGTALTSALQEVAEWKINSAPTVEGTLQDQANAAIAWVNGLNTFVPYMSGILPRMRTVPLTDPSALDPTVDYDAIILMPMPDNHQADIDALQILTAFLERVRPGGMMGGGIPDEIWDRGRFQEALEKLQAEGKAQWIDDEVNRSCKPPLGGRMMVLKRI